MAERGDERVRAGRGLEVADVVDHDVPDQVRLRQWHGAPIAPFTPKYVTKVGACENFYGVVFDREEGSPQIITGTDFSPQPGPGAGPSLCWEAQSVGFGTSNVFGSANHNQIATPYSNGWAVARLQQRGGSERALARPADGTTDVIDLTGTTAPAGADGHVLRFAGGRLCGADVPERRDHRQRQDVTCRRSVRRSRTTSSESTEPGAVTDTRQHQL